jgi:hypothetical protein
MWKVLAVAMALLVAAAGAQAKEWNVPLSSPSMEYELHGTIGKYPIFMHLAVTDVYRCTDDHLQFIVGDKYSGWYAYVKSGKHIAISGFYNSQGAGGASEHPPLDIYETAQGKHTGVFVTTHDSVFDGRWENFAVPQKTLPYSLQIVSSRILKLPEPDDSICPKMPSAETGEPDSDN